MKEIWKDIPGYKDYYQVSNLGRVKSLDRKVPMIQTHRKPCTQTIFGKILKLDKVHGYNQVALSKNGKTKVRKVHHLVLEVFVGPRPEGLVTNHKNGIRDDNRIDNLEYVTYRENTLHAINVLGATFGNNTGSPGEKNGSAKISRDDVVKIRKLRKSGKTYRAIGEIFGLGISQVSRITNGESWSHVER